MTPGVVLTVDAGLVLQSGTNSGQMFAPASVEQVIDSDGERDVRIEPDAGVLVGQSVAGGRLFAGAGAVLVGAPFAAGDDGLLACFPDGWNQVDQQVWRMMQDQGCCLVT